jgi:hypothetical protein
MIFFRVLKENHSLGLAAARLLQGAAGRMQ